MDITTYRSIDLFFDDLLSDIKCQQDTKSYIVGIYAKYKSSQHDLSQESITLLFAQARSNHDFAIYQNIGDWLFFYSSINDIERNKRYYHTIGQLSYNACYNLINRQWLLFNELSDNFTNLQLQVKSKLHDKLIWKSMP